MSEWIDLTMPLDQQEGTTSVVGTWLKKPGDALVADEPVVELETDKVNTELAAPASGILEEVFMQEGESVQPGEVLAKIRVGATLEETVPATAAATEETRPAPPSTEPIVTTPTEESRAHLLSPSVRKLFKEHGLDHTMVTGSGRGGRITYEDVCRYLASPARKAVAEPLPTSKGRLVPHNSMRRRIADHMVSSLLQTAPHVTAVFEMDMSAVIAHRKAHKQAFADKGVNLTFTAYFVAAAVEAIRAVPEVNSRFHADALEIFHEMHVGVGTALEDKGLIVPVIHGAHELNLQGIAAKLDDLTQRARSGKLTPGDISGGTFTISNHGVSGSLIAAPIIINQPQSAILGIGKLQKRVVVVEVDGQDATAIKPMCYVTLSIDHRALDAYHTNAFLSRFVQVIEHWSP